MKLENKVLIDKCSYLKCKEFILVAISNIASASGSFWFPKFIDFVKTTNISSNVRKIYFSFENKESKTRNQVLATVEMNTIELEKIYNNKRIETIYEVNEGNHFKDATLRMAKGIKWILE